MKFTVVCPENLEKVQKFAYAMDRSLKERTRFVPELNSDAAQADLLIMFGKKEAAPDTSICGFQSGNPCKIKAKITIACGENVTGDLRCGLSADCDLTFSSLQKNRLQICLLHPVVCPDGRVCEPLEFSSRGSVGNADALLAAAAVKILCGSEHK